MTVTDDQFKRFLSIFDRVLTSPRSNFYREKYKNENFGKKNLKSADEIPRVPRLTRQELSSTLPFDRLFSDLSEVRFIRYTSGTSGAPTLLLFRPEQRYKIPGKRPLILTANNHLDVYFAEAPRAEHPPFFPPLIHSAQSISATATLASPYAIDAIIGLPSKMLLLGKELPEPTRARITDLFIQGERFTSNLAAELLSYFPNAQLDPRYGMSEVGLFGYQCPALRNKQRGIYHCEKDYLLEVTDPDTGTWLPDGSEGELLITELYESPHQIIRYRTGDTGTIISKEPCPCGARFTFEVAGRTNHDIIKLAGGVLRTDEIERVMNGLTKWFMSDFRGIVQVKNEKNGKEIYVTLAVIPRNARVWHPEILAHAKTEIAKRLFLSPTKTLHDFLENKKIAGFNLDLTEKFPKETKAQRLRFLSVE